MVTSNKNWLLALFIAFVLTCSTSAQAAPAKADGAGHKADESHSHKTELFDFPQKWDLTIYSIIVFVLLLTILSKFAWPAITKGLKEREDLIAQAKDEAVKAKKAAEETQAKLTAEMNAAADRIRAMMDEARRDADVLRAKEREVGVKEAAAERERAKREIETAKDQALQEIYQKSVEVASLMSSKAIKRNMTAADHSRLIDEALSDLKLNLKN